MRSSLALALWLSLCACVVCRIVLDVYNGDTLRFICPEGVFSRVEEQVSI